MPLKRRQKILPTTTGVVLTAITLTACVGGQPEAGQSDSQPPSTGVMEPAGLTGAGVEELTAALEAGSVTSEELVTAYLARVEAFDAAKGDVPGLAAVTEVNERALDDARERDAQRRAGTAQGSLHGIPVLVKDIISIKGMRTAVATGEDDEYIVAADDATVVKKLREAGAIILAHTRTGEGATNPYDRELHPGGSSSGNGAGLAAGYAPIAVGEDTGGSIRYPAAWTSTVGMRSTPGLISMQGTSATSLWADTLGPQADSVADLATLMDVLAGYDPTHPASVDAALPDSYSDLLDEGYLQGKTIGILEPLRQVSDQNIIASFDKAVHVFEEAGATVVSMNASLPSQPAAAAENGTSMLLETPGGYSAGFSTPDSTLASDAYLSSLNADSAPIAKLAEPTDELTSDDLSVFTETPPSTAADPAKIAALETDRQSLRDWFAKAVDESGVDFVAYPPTRTFPVASELPPGSYKPNNELLATFLGYPAISVPGGFADTLPFGIEILGTAAFSDMDVLNAGFAFEQAASATDAPASTPPLSDEGALLE